MGSQKNRGGQNTKRMLSFVYWPCKIWNKAAGAKDKKDAAEGEVQEHWKWVRVGGAERRVSDFILNAAQEHKKQSSPFNIMLQAT